MKHNCNKADVDHAISIVKRHLPEPMDMTMLEFWSKESITEK